MNTPHGSSWTDTHPAPPRPGLVPACPRGGQQLAALSLKCPQLPGEKTSGDSSWPPGPCLPPVRFAALGRGELSPEEHAALRLSSLGGCSRGQPTRSVSTAAREPGLRGRHRPRGAALPWAAGCASAAHPGLQASPRRTAAGPGHSGHEGAGAGRSLEGGRRWLPARPWASAPSPWGSDGEGRCGHVQDFLQLPPPNPSRPGDLFLLLGRHSFGIKIKQYLHQHRKG